MIYKITKPQAERAERIARAIYNKIKGWGDRENYNSKKRSRYDDFLLGIKAEMAFKNLLEDKHYKYKSKNVQEQIDSAGKADECDFLLYNMGNEIRVDIKASKKYRDLWIRSNLINKSDCYIKAIEIAQNTYEFTGGVFTCDAKLRVQDGSYGESCKVTNMQPLRSIMGYLEKRAILSIDSL